MSDENVLEVCCTTMYMVNATMLYVHLKMDETVSCMLWGGVFQPCPQHVGQGSKLRHGRDPSPCSDHPGSLIHSTTRELLLHGFGFGFDQIKAKKSLAQWLAIQGLHKCLLKANSNNNKTRSQVLTSYIFCKFYQREVGNGWLFSSFLLP